MIARLTRYRATPEGLGALVDEVVARARANRAWPVTHPERRAEFFLTSSSNGECLSAVFGDDETVASAVEPERPAADKPRPYLVRALELGGPRESGVVDALFGRVVRCAADDVADLELANELLLPQVWVRAQLASSGGDEVLAIAVASHRSSLEESLSAFAARSTKVDDYDDVAYHFVSYRRAAAG